MKVGRRDSKSASRDAANSGALPSPRSDLTTLINRYGDVGLSAKDMVVLSGTLRNHSIRTEIKSNQIERLKIKKTLVLVRFLILTALTKTQFIYIIFILTTLKYHNICHVLIHYISSYLDFCIKSYPIPSKKFLFGN